MNSIIVATKNKHKFSEIQAFLKNHQSDGHQQTSSNQGLLVSVTLKSLLDYPELPEIDENCLSFVGNALKKAKVISEIVKAPVLADDSGLSVHALDGRPGVFSARYAGKDATDDQNNEKLLKELNDIPKDKRQATFICAMVLYFPDGSFFTSEGELAGEIIDKYRGKHGFGYDPIFFMPDRKVTLAEVPEAEKIKFSHRTQALQNLLKITNHFGQLASR
jgi:non-canonical purine NTP pyrophosphatase (RdgB/HAM1 family)